MGVLLRQGNGFIKNSNVSVFVFFRRFNKPDEKHSFVFGRYERVGFDFLSGFYIGIVVVDYKLRIPVMKIFQTFLRIMTTMGMILELLIATAATISTT